MGAGRPANQVVKEQTANMSDSSLERRQRTREHLDAYYSDGVTEGRYLGHQPVYGFNGPGHEKYQMVFLARVYHILRQINTFQFDSFLDVGGGEGYTANLVSKIFGAYAVTADISLEANRRARQLYDLDSLVLDAARLPFDDNTFDVVLCSEVIEHLESPSRAIQELLRVSRKGLIISTMEVTHGLFERKLRVQLRDLDAPHAEFNWWHPSDFSKLLGTSGLSHTHILNVREYAESNFDDTRFSESQAWDLVGRMHQNTAFGTPYGRGILVVKRKADTEPVSQLKGEELLQRAASIKLPLDYTSYPERQSVSDELASRLQCPVSRGGLQRAEGGLYNEASKNLYPIRSGIPDMIPASPLPDSDMNPLDLYYRKLFSPSNVASTPAKRKFYYVQMRCIERWRSISSRPHLAARAIRTLAGRTKKQ